MPLCSDLGLPNTKWLECLFLLSLCVCMCVCVCPNSLCDMEASIGFLFRFKLFSVHW